MRETLKLFKTLETSRDDFNVLDNFNVPNKNGHILVANFATNYQDLVIKVKNLVALAPLLSIYIPKS